MKRLHLWTISATASFMYQQCTAAVHIYLKVRTTDSLAFFSKHISRMTILSLESVITCNLIFIISLVNEK